MTIGGMNRLTAASLLVMLALANASASCGGPDGCSFSTSSLLQGQHVRADKKADVEVREEEDEGQQAKAHANRSHDDPDAYMNFCETHQVDRRRREGSCNCRRRWSAWGWDHDYKCVGDEMKKRQAPTPKPTAEITHHHEEDLLTVMSYNTYLLGAELLGGVFDFAIDIRPNLDQRGPLTADWFNSMEHNEAPDVLVLQEIYSDQGEDMMRRICSNIWTKNTNLVGNHRHGPYISCDQPGSPFGYATRVLNPTHGVLKMTGGVVILVRKGIEITDTDDVQFEGCAGDHCYTDIGFWAVTIEKGSKKCLVIGTHATAYEENEYVLRREKEFKQMRDYVNTHTDQGGRVVFAGDMNVFTNDYKDKDGNTVVVTEFGKMLELLGNGPNAPAMAGTHVPRGFWLELNQSMAASCTPVTNHFLEVIPIELRLGNQTYDWVLAPGPGDPLATPYEMKYQMVPVQAHICYEVEEARSGWPKGTMTDELSDHYAIFTAIRWTEQAPEYTTVLKGHRGADSGRLPSATSCPQ
jgi:exonuclease III